MGVPGEHEINEMAPGMGDDGVGVVGLVGHKEDGTVGFLGDGEIQVGVAGAGVVYAAEPETGAVAFDGEMLVDENRCVMSSEGFDDKGSVKGDIMVAEDGVPERGGKGGEYLSTAANCVTAGDEGERAVGDEVTGEQDEIGGESINVVDDALKEEGFRVLVEVDVADLDDAIAMEGRGQIWDRDGALDDVNLVACNLAGIESESGGCGPGTYEEVAAGKS
jgi:hypothetical protein